MTETTEPPGDGLTTTGLVERQPFTLVPTSLTEAMAFAKMIAASDLCPKDFRRKPEDVLIAVQMGMEIAGCSPMQALQNIAVINGRPCMWGDLVLACVKNSGLLEWIKEADPVECEETKTGRCEVKRKGDPEPVVRTFTLEQANTAGLVKRSTSTGTWSTYPGRMLQMRARSLALRDVFPDVLKGMRIREEQEDYEEPQKIEMPKRTSEIEDTAALVDDFVANPHQPGKGKQTAMVEPGTWTGALDRIELKSGKTKGKAWTLYTIIALDGSKFGTFDTKIRDAAQDCFASDMEVSIEYEQRQGRMKQIKTLKAARPAVAE